MAGPVKGTIGQEDVILNDAATETTLLKLLAAVQKQGGGAGGGAGGGGGGAKEAQQRLIGLAQQTGKTEKELEDFEEDVEKAGNALTRGFAHLGQGIQNMALEFMSGSTRLSDFSSHITGVISNIPIIGGALGGTMQLLVSVIDNQIDTFRELSQIGVDFGSQLTGARSAAASAGLSLEIFQGVVSQNAESLALFAGSATEGARRFANISKQVQANQLQFSRLGLTMEETAEYTADYLALQTRLGRSQRMTDAQLAAGVQSTVMELDKLARITGKQREQLMKEMQENLNDKRIRLLVSTMSTTAQQALNGVLSMVGDASPEMKDAITELVATNGVPVSDFGKSLMRLNPNLGTMAAGLANGTVTQEQYMAEVRRTAESVANMSEEEKRLAGILSATGNSAMDAQIALISMQNAGAGAAGALNAQQQAAADRERNLANFENVIVNLKNTIWDALISTGIFETVQGAMSDLVGFFSSPEGIDGIRNAIQPMVDWFKSLVSDLTSAENPMDVIKSYLADGLSNIGSFIVGMIGDAISSMLGFGGSSSSETDENGAPATDSGSGDESTGWFSSISNALGTFGAMVAVGSAVYIAIKGFQTLLAGFAAPAVAAGALVITALLVGTGAAIKLAGDGISAAGDGVQKIADGLEQMGKIEGAENIKDLGSALGDMGTAMLALGAGNVLDSITSFFGASSPFEKMVEGINEFSGVNQQALANMTASGGALDSLKAFSDDIDSSKVEDFAEAIEKLAEAMEDLNEAYSESSGFFGRNAPGSQEILQAISTGAQQGGAGLNNSIGQLIELMRENNTLTRRILNASGESVY